MPFSRRQTLTAVFLVSLSAAACSSGAANRNPDTTGASGGPAQMGGPIGGTSSGGSSGSQSGASAVAGSQGTAGASGSGSSGVGCAAPPGSDFDPMAMYVAPKYAATEIVTSAANDGTGSLRATLSGSASGAIVGFDAALAGKTITLLSVIELPEGITIDGTNAPAVTIDGADATPLFHFNGDAPTRLRFFGLHLTRGHTMGSGGAISLNGGALDVEIGGCTFESNSGSEGGAVRVGYGKGTKLDVHDSVFRNNDGSLSGPGNGFSAGAISATGGNVHVTRCRFDGNQGPTTGALYTIHSDPVVEDSVFIKNKSTRPNGGSGAFFADGGGPGDYGTNYADPVNQIPGQITLMRTLFEGNRGAGDDSGAVEAYAYPLDTVTFDACLFRDNVSDPGRAGAAFVHADKLVKISRTAFVHNHATQPGGAIWADGDARYELENVLFSDNATDGDLGGALRLNISDKAALRIQSSTFADNTATSGNGALWMGGQRDAHVANCIFANNTGSSGSQQINFSVTDDGGNILWPDPRAQTPTLAEATIVDPGLGPLTVQDGVELRIPSRGSPAIDAAVMPAPTVDQRGAPRGQLPDVGSVEVASGCGS